MNRPYRISAVGRARHSVRAARGQPHALGDSGLRLAGDCEPYRISAVGRAWSQSGRFMIYE